MQGWISLHRKLLENPIFDNPNLLKVWIWCLLKASHKDHDQLVGLQVIPLKEGQFVTGRFSGAKELRLNPSTFYKYLRTLENMQMVELNSDNKMTVVSVENWTKYQNSQNEEYQQNNNKITTKCQQSNTNNNDKNVNNVNKEYIEHFEKLWKLYPNKKGKGQIKDSHKKKIFELGEEFERCITRYTADKEDWKQWQNGSTFFKSGYVDFLDANYEGKPAEKVHNIKSFDRKTKFHPKESRAEKYTADELNKVADRKREAWRNKQKEAKEKFANGSGQSKEEAD